MVLALSFNRSHALACAGLAAFLVAGCSPDGTQLQSTYTGTTTIDTSVVPVPATAFNATTTSPTVVGGVTVLGQTGTSTGFTAGDTLTGASAPQVTITDVVSNLPPSGVTALAFKARSAAGAAGARRTSATFQGTAIDYLTVSANAMVTFSGAPTFTFTLPYLPPNYNFYLAAYEPATANYDEDYAGPATASGSKLTFTGPSTPAYAFTGTNSFTYALYALPTGDTPIPYTGTGTVSATPSTLTFSTSSSPSQTFVAAETLNGAADATTFSAASDNAAVATVTQTSTPGTFSVTAVGAGNATITVTAADGSTTPVAVSVTGVPVTVSGRRR